MDWFSWLSKTSLDPSLVYEYGLAFSHNELEEDDIPYLNHELLQSMGISIAKHRLEILKLAKKERISNNNNNFPISRLIISIKRTKKAIVEFIQTLACRDESALVLASKKSYSSSWGGAMSKRNSRRQVSNTGKQERLLLTNGDHNTPLEIVNSRIHSFSSPRVYDVRGYDKMDGYDDPYWSAPVEEIKWDSMFQDLKPT